MERRSLFIPVGEVKLYSLVSRCGISLLSMYAYQQPDFRDSVRDVEEADGPSYILKYHKILVNSRFFIGMCMTTCS